MKKWWQWLIVGLVVIALGVGGAYAYNRAYPVTSAAAQVLSSTNGRQREFYNSQIPGRRGMGPGMMNGWGRSNQKNTGTRIPLNQAVQNSEAYLKQYDANLKIKEVMEFQQNYYVAVIESDTGRGAMELLVNPYTGAVSPEIGPNMRWNLKYAPMGRLNTGTITDNKLTLSDAQAKAKAALQAQGKGAVLNTDGISFYGYYTFDYSINGKIAGMLSVNGLDGSVAFHTWHGQFIEEKEF